MKTLVRLKKILTLVGAALFASAASAVTITIDRVQQRYPWNGLVDIDYTLSDNVSESAQFNVVATVDGVDYPARTFKALFDKSAGSHRVTWNTEADGVSLFTKNATFSLSVTIEKELDYDTVIVDLRTGKYTTAMLGADNYESINTDENKTEKLVLRVVPAHTFTMLQAVGNWPGLPTHQVALSSYMIGVFELTQKQWEIVTGEDPSTFCIYTNQLYYASRPLDYVSFVQLRGPAANYSWPNDGHAVSPDSFFGKLRALTKAAGTEIEFDLLTEAQWQDAAQAGETTGGDYGYIADYLPDLSSVAAIGRNSKDHNIDLSNGTNKVGSYPPNRWGLYDMPYNAFEVVLDNTGNPNSEDANIDPVGMVAERGHAKIYRSHAHPANKDPRTTLVNGHGFSWVTYRGSMSVTLPYRGSFWTKCTALGARVGAPVIK